MTQLLSRKYLFRAHHKTHGVLQVINTLIMVWALFQGFAWHYWAIAGLFYFYYFCVGLSVGNHRYFCHNTFKTNKAGRWLMILAATLGGFSSPGAWALTHDRHHAFSDKPGDPHNPKEHGWKMMLTWFYPSYTASSWELRQYFKEGDVLFAAKYHNLIVLGWVGLLYLIDPWLVIFAWAIPYAVTSYMATLIAISTHMQGFGTYRNFEIDDDSQNVLWLGYITFGEGWHHNHHKYRGRKHFGVKWWEVDLGYYVVKLLETQNGIRGRTRVPSVDRT